LLLNTIEPIKQAVEYLHTIDRHPSDITPRNIVVTEKGDIKLIDDLLLSSETVYQQQQHSKEGDYTRLLQTTLRLIDGSRPDSPKTFKQQLKKLKARTSREMYRFLDELYEKSKPVAPKLKKIRKRMSVNN
jgi:tRNA A-37 threonylcarbamoyl transferase component Bud32